MVALIAVTATVFALLLIYLTLLIRPPKTVKPTPELLCDYAHRGLHGNGVPENSLTAFSLACEAGVGIELDVQLSSDGQVMVFHDYSLKRMTGTDALLSHLTAEELSALRLAGTEERIPTLEEVLALVAGRVPILVELKGENTNTALCERVAPLLEGYGGAYCAESFNPMLVGAMKKRLPKVFCGLLYTNVCRDKKKYSALNLALTAMALNVVARPDFIAYNKADRHSLFVKLAAGLYRAPRFVWTVKTAEEKALAHTLGELPIFENEV